jgi:hypothetical protein
MSLELDPSAVRIGNRIGMPVCCATHEQDEHTKTILQVLSSHVGQILLDPESRTFSGHSLQRLLRAIGMPCFLTEHVRYLRLVNLTKQVFNLVRAHRRT